MTQTTGSDSNAAIGKDVYIAPTAYVAGDVVFGDQCTVMHFVCIRGDVAPIRIGARVNIQDGSMVHCRTGVPLEIGEEASIGHHAVVHGRRVGRRTLIGIGAIVLDDCEIGDDCVIAAGALVPPRTVIPDGKLVMGVPGRIVRDTTQEERAYASQIVQSYLRLGREHAAGRYPPITSSRSG